MSLTPVVEAIPRYGDGPCLPDAYTVLSAEYDLMALQVERMADDLVPHRAATLLTRVA